jgi:hypothetical protein
VGVRLKQSSACAKREAVSEAGRTWQIFDRFNRQTRAHDDEEIDSLSVLCKKILVGGCNALVEKSDVGLKQQVEAIGWQSCGHSFVEHTTRRDHPYLHHGGRRSLRRFALFTQRDTVIYDVCLYVPTRNSIATSLWNCQTLRASESPERNRSHSKMRWRTSLKTAIQRGRWLLPRYCTDSP